MNSIPKIDQKINRLNTLKGMVPSILDMGMDVSFVRVVILSEKCEEVQNQN